jgi:hypothetical protein
VVERVVQQAKEKAIELQSSAPLLDFGLLTKHHFHQTSTRQDAELVH